MIVNGSDLCLVVAVGLFRVIFGLLDLGNVKLELVGIVGADALNAERLEQRALVERDGADIPRLDALDLLNVDQVALVAGFALDGKDVGLTYRQLGLGGDSEKLGLGLCGLFGTGGQRKTAGFKESGLDEAPFGFVRRAGKKLDGFGAGDMVLGNDEIEGSRHVED